MEEIKNESKRERFKRLAEKRTNKVLESLRVLSNCANRGQYEYGEEDISKIFSAIEDVLTDTKSKFKNKKRKEFKL